MKTKIVSSIILISLVGLSTLAQKNNSSKHNTIKQQELLEFTNKLLESSNNEIPLPEEYKLLIGDSTEKIYYVKPDWNSVNFNKRNNKDILILPLSTNENKTGKINSRLEVEHKKAEKYRCVVKTFIPSQKSLTNNYSKAVFSGVVLESGINGIFTKGRIYSNGIASGEIEGEEQNKVEIWKAKRSNQQVVSVYNEYMKQKAKKEFQKAKQYMNINTWDRKSKEEENLSRLPMPYNKN